jgi:hypothetical protein
LFVLPGLERGAASNRSRKTGEYARREPAAETQIEAAQLDNPRRDPVPAILAPNRLGAEAA